MLQFSPGNGSRKYTPEKVVVGSIVVGLVAASTSRQGEKILQYSKTPKLSLKFYHELYLYRDNVTFKLLFGK